MGRHADSKTVPGECRVPILVHSLVHIAVVAIVNRYIPIRAIEPDAVGENLESSSWTTVRLAIGRGDVVAAADCRVLGSFSVETAAGFDYYLRQLRLPVCNWRPAASNRG